MKTDDVGERNGKTTGGGEQSGIGVSTLLLSFAKTASIESEATTEEPEAYEPTFEEIVTSFVNDGSDDEDSMINLDFRIAEDAAFAQLLKEVEEEEGDSHLHEREENAGDVYTAKSAKLTLAKFHQLARTLRYSGKARRAWEECASRLGMSARRVRRTGKTRWNEHLEQCKDIVQMEKLIIDYQKYGSLQPLARLASLVSSAKVSQIGDAIRWIDELSALFDDILTTPAAHPPALHNAVLRGWRMLQKYYSYTDDSPFYRVALLLHPSPRISYMKNVGWTTEWTATAVQVAEEMYGNYKRDDKVGSAQSEEMPPPPPPKRSRIAAHLASAALTPSPTSSNPLHSFINDSPIVNCDKSPKDAFAYWVQERDAGREHGGLTELALDLFSTPLSSDAVGCAFSIGRAFATEKRHGLASRTICEGLALGACRADMVPEGLLADLKGLKKAGRVKVSALKAVGVADGLRTPLETSTIVIE
ncbi:hypothetical protein JCM10296v2_001598 [Rhodotorula toruloides]